MTPVCPNCRESLDPDATSCPECGVRPRDFSMPDPWDVAAGLDLRALETTRSYRQSKFRRA